MQQKARSTLKKHSRIKSQQHINNYHLSQHPSMPSFTRSGKMMKNSMQAYFILQIKNITNGGKQTININPCTPMHIVKEIICKKMKVEKDDVYFVSTNDDYNFDYRLDEDIGVLDSDKSLTIHYKQPKFNAQTIQTKDKYSQINTYIIYDCLSVGGFSKVFRVRSKITGRFHVAKFIQKNVQQFAKFQQLIYNQKYINQILDHPMLVRMQDFIETDSFYIFILQYCPSGQLFTLMKQHRDMSESQARFYFIQVLLGIEYMHNQSIIYRDIKPENILLDKNGHIKIADFGLAKIMKQKSTSYCGSLQYMAPEIVRGDEHSFTVDYYCLGSLLYEMMVGCPPFYNPNFTVSQTKHHIVNSTPRFPSDKRFSNKMMDFILRLLEKNPNNRMGSMGGIRQILCHPWIGNFDKQAYRRHEIEPPFKRSMHVSNFQTTYLPVNDIEQVRCKIDEEMRSLVNEDNTKVTQSPSPRRNPFEKQKQRKRFKSTELLKYEPTITPGNKKESTSPYAQQLSKLNSSKKSHHFVQKNASKSLHVSTVFKSCENKNRSLTKNSKNGIYLYPSTISRSLPKKDQIRKTFESVDQTKKSLHLPRKPNNTQKQNILRFKLDKKSKQLKERVQGDDPKIVKYQQKQQLKHLRLLKSKLNKAMGHLFMK